MALACFQGNNGACWPGLRTLAAYAGLSLSATKHALKELKDKGFLEHKYDESKMRHVFCLKIPVEVTREFCQRTGIEDLVTRVESSPQPGAAASEDFRPKAQGKGEAPRKIDPRAEFEVFQDVTPPDYLREKYERARGEDDEWNGVLTAPTAQRAVQNENQAPGAQTGTGECSTGHRGVLNRAPGSAQMSTRVEGSAQIGTAFAETHNTSMDKTIEKTTDKRGGNLLKALDPNGEESKSEQNFQLGEEEKVGLEPKTPSAEPDVSETKAPEGDPSAVLVDSSPSAGHPAPSSPTRGFVLDPKTGRIENYAQLPPWARHMVAGLLNLRRERESLLSLLPGAQGAERVMIQARIRDIEEEMTYGEARLAELLAQETGQTAGAAEAAVAVGEEVGR
jgi:hypothetical protein